MSATAANGSLDGTVMNNVVLPAQPFTIDSQMATGSILAVTAAHAVYFPARVAN